MLRVWVREQGWCKGYGLGRVSKGLGSGCYVNC